MRPVLGEETETGGGGCRGLIGRDGGDDAVAISASRHSSRAA